MKDLLKKPVTFEKVEFWIVTAIYAFTVYVLAYNQYIQIITGDLNTPNVQSFEMYNLPYSYSKDYFIPQFFINTAIYTSFLLLNFFIIKPLINGRYVFLNILLSIVLLIATAAVLGTADTWIKSYLFHDHSEQYVHHFLFKQDAIVVFCAFIVFVLYTFIKYILRLVLANYNPVLSGNKQLLTECGVAFGLWCLFVYFMTMSYMNFKVTVMWGEVILFGIISYGYLSYSVIPDAMNKRQELTDYLMRVFGLLCISIPFIALVVYLIFNRLNMSFYMSLFNGSLVMLVIAPACWFLYKYRLSKNNELLGLKTALGSSTANLDFLRSQINPHFLFNALNTLYGTSLQENAERTGEGIQKLGDMMRFMLQENVQEKISLEREVNYLNNYIALQKLRTQTSPDILIHTEIDEQLSWLEIAPMLLIPFVENAFKHGISLREPSHIKISLQTRDNELFFDVSNSIHPKTGTDPEKHKSGIGLENVRQRLLLLYPNRHELMVRESAREFFIHLTIKLNS